MGKIQSDVLASQSIDTALLVSTFTASVDYEAIRINVLLSGIDGSGDYSVYLTHQKAGAGEAYKSDIKTDAVGAVTNHLFASMFLSVEDTDVVKVYVTGLAGDNDGAVGITTEWWSALMQSDILSDATPFAGAYVDGAITDIPTGVWASATRTLTSFGTLVADVWAYATRTLTMTTAQVLAVVEDGDDLTVLRGDTLSIAISGLGSIATRSKLYFTARKLTIKADSDSVIQVEETDDMLYLMGLAPVSPIVATDATLTVDEQTAGDITVLIKPRASKEFVQGAYEYDVQVVNADESVHTLVQGTFSVTQDVTRATA